MTVNPQTLIDLQMTPDQIETAQIKRGEGCHNCSETGYKGRVAVYEVMTMHDELKEMLLNGASTAELKSEAVRLGMRTLRQSAIRKMLEGMTTADEVARVSAAD